MKQVLIGVVLEVWLVFLGGAGREECCKQKMQGRGDIESKGIGKKHAHALYLRHHRLSQDGHPFLQVRAGPLCHGQVLAPV